MKIQELLKTVLIEHKHKIEIIQWAIISSVSSLVYSEYIIRIKQKQVPTRAILVPQIKVVESFLGDNSEFISRLSNELIDGMSNHEMLKKYLNAPELILFEPDNIEILKTVFDVYMIPNIVRRIPETISIKFGLNDPSQQLIREERTIDIFPSSIYTMDNMVKYVIDQAVLQLLVLLPTMKKDVELPDTNTSVYLSDKEIFTINHEKAICPIHFSNDIYTNENILNILSFVTDTQFEENDWSVNPLTKGDDHDPITYIAHSSVFNRLMITRLKGIELNTEK